MNQKRKLPFDILDSIRGIAALYVVIAHCRGALWIGGSEYSKMFPPGTWSFGDYAMFGTSMFTRLAVEFVIVFFVLSGFSIAHSLSGNHSPLEFYKRRLIRIYPSYLMALVWAGLVFIITRYWHAAWYDGSINQFALIRPVEMNDYFEWDVIIRNLFYMPGHGYITPLWSLTYEVIFYLLAPFLLRRKNLYFIISVVLFLFNMVLPGTIQSLQLNEYFYQFLFVYNIYFAMGIFLYVHYERISGWFTEYTKFELLLILGGFFVIMFGANLYLKMESDFTFLEAALLSVMLIIFFLKYEVRIPWLMKIGRFSYTLYITHFASIYLYLGIYWLIFNPQVPYILNFFIWMPAVLFAVGIAFVQYLAIERNTKHILERLRKKQPAPTAIQAGIIGLVFCIFLEGCGLF